MRILGPLTAPTTSAVTATLASAEASVVTDSPSTSRIAGSETVSPAAPDRRSTSSTSPTATLCCLPPLRTTAYTATPWIVETGLDRAFEQGARGTRGSSHADGATGQVYGTRRGRVA